MHAANGGLSGVLPPFGAIPGRTAYERTTGRSMPARDRELVLARLSRIEVLLGQLERICTESADIRLAVAKAHAEIARVTERLKPVTRGLHGEPKA